MKTESKAARIETRVSAEHKELIERTAHAFYTKFNFLTLPKINSRLFLPIATAEKLFDS